MSMSEILSIAIPCILLLASIFGVYLKVKIDITKLDMRINAINRELLQKEIGSLLSEKINREDHIHIINKLDQLMEIYSKK
jgi:hypothetical protein